MLKEISTVALMTSVLFLTVNSTPNLVGEFSNPSVQEKQKHSKLVKVEAKEETDAVANAGDAADDPAIWVHPHDSEKSKIIGTNKEGG